MRYCGFSLLEVMISLCITGIIISLAIPAYQTQILASRRGNVTTYLLQLHLAQEAFRMQNKTYATINDLVLQSSDYYKFSFSNVTATSFLIEATAIDSQVEDRNCKTISIDQSFDRKPKHCW